MQATVDRLMQAAARLIFDHPRFWLAVFAVVTVLLGISASGLRVDAAFNKMIPLEHPYMRVFTEYRDTFGGANRVIVALKQRDGDIFNKPFFDTLKQVTDEVFFIPGVDRPTVTSLFTPNVRYIEVIEEGFSGGNVIPADFQGTPEDLERVRRNVLKSGGVGRLVANDFSAALVRAELLEVDPVSGEKLDYQQVAERLEAIRAKYQTDDVSVHIIGFAKAVGDIADGARGVIAFFFVAFFITALLLYWYSSSWKLTALALVCALMPVAWLLGLLPLIGYGIDPMSILVPFLIFAIGVSHAVQMTNAWKLETLHGADGVTASKRSFLKLFIPGAVALLANALGFMVILHIKIAMVQELAITASLGVLLMIITNKMLLPILLSYIRLRPGEVERASGKETRGDALWRRISLFAQTRTARWVIPAALALLALGAWQAHDLKTGDLGVGTPELREDSRYNLDVRAITGSFSIGVDVLSVIAQTYDVPGACTDYGIMRSIDDFVWHMTNTAGVHSVLALTDFAKTINAGWNEGNIKWRVLSRNPDVLAQSVTPVDTGSGLLNSDCSAMQVLIFTRDHQGETIAHIADAVRDFKREHDSEQLRFLLASGNVGVMVATNEAVDAAEITMLISLFGAISALCLVTFRSWRATLCIVLPLGLVSVLCNALMALLDIGLKVSTLPVIALGVGVGVDYGIYLFERMKHEMEERGLRLADAFHEALRQRGTAAVFTAVTMTIGVGSWAFSALKFQADMGLLLAFMFLVNMLGAIFLLPALAAYLVRPAARSAA